MSIQRNGMEELLKRLELTLEQSFSILPNYLVVVKVKEIEALIDRIYQSIPGEIQEAMQILRRKDDLQLQAQKEAERIIYDAQNEAARLLSEADILRKVQQEAEKIKAQVLLECDEVRKRALNDAENIRIQAVDEAKRLKDEADIYAERVLANLEHDLTELHKEVKNGQIYMEKLRSENNSNLSQIYPQSSQSEASQSDDFVIE